MRRCIDMTPEFARTLADAYLAGASLGAVGRAHRVTEHWVKRALDICGVPARPPMKARSRGGDAND